MALERALFPLCNELGVEVGDRVVYVQHADGITKALAGEDVTGPTPVAGEGTVTAIWLGIEEIIEVRDEDRGATVSLVLALGDVVTRGASTP